MADPDGPIDDLARAILDDVPVDWDAAESRAADADRPLVRQLRALAGLRRVTHSSPGAVSAPGECWGPLRLLEPIGRGAFGTVYRAWDTRLDREVALKLLPAPVVRGHDDSSIIEEGRLLARVRHPNVVTIYGAERVGDHIGLWMELVEGHTLEELLKDGKTFTVSEVVGLGLQICHAVSAVHGSGLIHRDIKAQNVMVDGAGRAVLMDFGTGLEADDTTTAPAGTPLYLAPEMLTGRDASTSTDIYALGVLLYHLLTNTYPVRATSLADLRAAHQRLEHRSLAAERPGLPSGLIRAVERATAHDPARRHRTVEALARDLQRLAPRSKLVRTARLVAAAAAIVLVTWTAWEVRGRQGDRLSPTRATLAAWLPSLAPGVQTTGRPAIAVLPLENLSAEPDSEYFADGLTEDIIRSLASVEGLEVRSRTSAFAFKGRRRNVREIGDQLGVNLVVEGSVQHVGSQVRVTARLVSVAGDVLLWSERFDRDNTVKDILAIQDEIASGIVSRLRLKLGAPRRRYDTNIDTYNLYLRARAAVDERGSRSQEAARLFQGVIDRDPEFAPAYAGLADAHAFLSRYVHGPSAESVLPQMRQAAARALELDDLLAEGHAAMGFVHARERHWALAGRSFQRAIALNPGLTQAYTNYCLEVLLPQGKTAEAERLLLVAQRYDPLSLSLQRELAHAYVVAGRYDEAIDILQQVARTDPRFEYVDMLLARALTFAGRWSEALPAWDVYWADLQARVGAREVERPGSRFWMATAYVMSGRRAEVEAMITDQVHPFRRAVLHAALGDKDRTFEALDQAVTTVPHRVALLLVHPEMALLRGDPRLAGLRQKLGLP